MYQIISHSKFVETGVLPLKIFVYINPFSAKPYIIITACKAPILLAVPETFKVVEVIFFFFFFFFFFFLVGGGGGGGIKDRRFS